ncbi:MAG: DUF4261 domain-containing protein [Comamonas sp.]
MAQPQPTEIHLAPDMWSFEALYATQPVLDGEVIRAALAERLGDVELLMEGDVILLALHDYTVDYGDKKDVPSEIAIMLANQPCNPSEYTEALTQTWDWPEKEAALAQCQHSVLVSEFMGRGLETEERLEVIQAVMHVMIENGGITAISQTNAGCLIKPERYISMHAEGSVYYGVLNVRFFNISNHPGEMLMDSLGLATFGLPDVQCHFKALNPPEVSRFLFNTAAYLIQNGDVIQDGHTLPSIDGQGKWPCQHEEALIPPERMVLDVNPGLGLAAGNR